MEKLLASPEFEPLSEPTNEAVVSPVLLPDHPGQMLYEHRLRARAAAFHEDVATHTNAPEIDEAIAQELDEFEDAVYQGVDERWLHPDAEVTVKKMDEVKILSGESLNKYIPKGAGGFQRDQENLIVIRFGREKPTKFTPQEIIRINMRVGLKHELNHAVLGKLPYTWLNEAATEHIAQTMSFGHPEIVYPYSRPGDSERHIQGGYVEARVLLHKLLTGGSKQIPASLATRAYSDPAGVQGEAFKELSRQLDESWGGKNVLENVNSRVQQYENELKKTTSLTKLQVEKEALKKVNSDLREVEKTYRAA